MKKKELLIIIVIIVIVLLAILGIIKVSKNDNNGNNEKPPEVVIVPKLQTTYQIKDNCINMEDNKCLEKSSMYYHIDDFNNNPDLENIIRDINNTSNNTDLIHENDIDSNDECSNAKEVYKNRYSDKSIIYYYSNETFTVITYDLISIDVCSRKESNPRFDVYYYDVKWQKVIDQDKLLNILGLNKKEVKEKIVKNLVEQKLVKNEKEYNKLLSDKKISSNIYMDMLGNLLVRFIDYKDNSFATFQIASSEDLNLEIKDTK